MIICLPRAISIVILTANGAPIAMRVSEAEGRRGGMSWEETGDER